MDFTCGNSQNNQVTVFTGDGTGSFSDIQNYNADNGIRGLVIIDNGDGFPTYRAGMSILCFNKN
jgi:hypothetical protein